MSLAPISNGYIRTTRPLSFAVAADTTLLHSLSAVVRQTYYELQIGNDVNPDHAQALRTIFPDGTDSAAA